MYQRYSFVFLFQMEDSISTGQKSLQLLGTPLGVLKAQVEEEVRQSFWTSFAQSSSRYHGIMLMITRELAEFRRENVVRFTSIC